MFGGAFPVRKPVRKCKAAAEMLQPNPAEPGRSNTPPNEERFAVTQVAAGALHAAGGRCGRAPASPPRHAFRFRHRHFRFRPLEDGGARGADRSSAGAAGGGRAGAGGARRGPGLAPAHLPAAWRDRHSAGRSPPAGSAGPGGTSRRPPLGQALKGFSGVPVRPGGWVGCLALYGTLRGSWSPRRVSGQSGAPPCARGARGGRGLVWGGEAERRQGLRHLPQLLTLLWRQKVE